MWPGHISGYMFFLPIYLFNLLKMILVNPRLCNFTLLLTGHRCLQFYGGFHRHLTKNRPIIGACGLSCYKWPYVFLQLISFNSLKTKLVNPLLCNFTLLLKGHRCLQIYSGFYRHITKNIWINGACGHVPMLLQNLNIMIAQLSIWSEDRHTWVKLIKGFLNVISCLNQQVNSLSQELFCQYIFPCFIIYKS